MVGHIAKSPAEIIHIAGLLRGTESGWQAISYGVNSVAVMASVGGVYLNFGLWAVSLIPAWFVVGKIGVPKDDGEVENESVASPSPVDT